MSKIIKVLKSIRNNWKKTAFGTAAFSYGLSYAKDQYETEQLMTQYCLDAVEYGNMSLPIVVKPRHVTVILNPAANKRKARKNFEKYCAPLLHLAGISVEVIQTEFEGQARGLAEKLEEATDAVVVAGGDGTLSETVTGILRRTDGAQALSRKFPIGVLPLGQTNTVAVSLFGSRGTDKVQLMADATMAIIKAVTKPVDVMKIEVLETEEEKPGKPVYSLSGVQWGAYRDAHARRDKYWYWGMFRSYVSYVFMGLKSEASGVTWKCEAEINYALPCAGCSKCFSNQQNSVPERKLNNQMGSRWWHTFVPREKTYVGVDSAAPPSVDYSKIVNESCGEMRDQEVSTVDLSILTANVQPSCSKDGTPHIDVTLGPTTVGYFDFIMEGWRRVNKKASSVLDKLEVRELTLKPKDHEKKAEGVEKWISIDNEDYEVKPIHITLLPKKVHLFCNPVDIA